MPFLAIVYKNLLRRPNRSLLTIASIAVGIAAMVALISLAWGFERGWERAYAVGGTGLIVTKLTTESIIPAAFDQARVRELLKLPHVQQASGVLTDLVGIEVAPTMLVFGWEPNTFLWDHVRLVSGRWPANDDERAVALGIVAKDVLGKRVGSPVQIETTTFTVRGIFESDALLENGAVVMRLPQLQEVMDQSGKINFLNLKLVPGTTPAQIDELRRSVVARWPGFQAFTSAGEVARNNTTIQFAKAMSWAISAIALVVGAIGVMNVMLMSVFERVREIGILLAIGWGRRRIVRMILYESFVLSLVGGAVGIATGIAAVKLLERTTLIRGKIEGEFSLLLFGVAFGISIALGGLGGLYPAYRSSRLHPSDALRYE